MPAQGRLADKAQVPIDSHGCPACPHPGIGPAIAGSPDVNVNKMPALRVGDPGIHMACCGPNTWTADQGAPTVFFNQKAAFRQGDPSKHCGGNGKLIEGSPNVLTGSETTSGGGAGGGGGASAARSSSSSSSSSGGGGGAAAAQAGGSSSNSARDPAAAPPPSPKVHVLSRALVGIGGTPLVEHQVELVDPPTGERAHGPFTTDDNGHLFVELPDARPYHLRIIDDADPDEWPPLAGFPPEDEAMLDIVLVDLARAPLANRRWQVTFAGGGRFTGTTAADGAIRRGGITPGVYDVEVGPPAGSQAAAQTYQVHTLHHSDLPDADADAAPCTLIVR